MQCMMIDEQGATHVPHMTHVLLICMDRITLLALTWSTKQYLGSGSSRLLALCGRRRRTPGGEAKNGQFLKLEIRLTGLWRVGFLTEVRN